MISIFPPSIDLASCGRSVRAWKFLSGIARVVLWPWFETWMGADAWFSPFQNEYVVDRFAFAQFLSSFAHGAFFRGSKGHACEPGRSLSRVAPGGKESKFSRRSNPAYSGSKISGLRWCLRWPNRFPRCLIPTSCSSPLEGGFSSSPASSLAEGSGKEDREPLWLWFAILAASLLIIEMIWSSHSRRHNEW